MPLRGRLVFHCDLCLPHMPAGLEGLRIAHLSDLHITRRRRRYRRISAELVGQHIDLVFLTGDYMTTRKLRPVVLEVLGTLCGELNPRLGIYGVWGNHDTQELREASGELPIHWLNNEAHRPQGLPLLISGADTDSSRSMDAVALACNLVEAWRPEDGCGCSQERPLRLLLAHFPDFLPTASDMGLDIMFAGHTHGGQCRLPGPLPLTNSTDLPLKLTSGLLRHRNTLCAISRGIGEVALPFRVFCPPHVPLYTLRRGPLPGLETEHIHNIRPW